MPHILKRLIFQSTTLNVAFSASLIEEAEVVVTGVSLANEKAI